MSNAMRDERERILASYGDGVTAVERVAEAVLDWGATTPCPEWNATDLAGHLLAVTFYYDGLLEAAMAGQPRTELPIGADLAAMNARDLAALPSGTGPARIGEFVVGARRYLDRIAGADWELVLGHWAGVGPLTLGQHTHLAVGEWHIHAWDLARSAGLDHEPADPETVAEGRRVLPQPLPPGDPWPATLAWAGRAS